MAIGRRKKFDDIFSRVDTMHQRVRRTNWQRDGRTDTGRQQRPRFHIVSGSRGENYQQFMLCFSEVVEILMILFIFSWIQQYTKVF